MEQLYWATKTQGQERALKPKEVQAASLLGFTEEIWDRGLPPKHGQTPSFPFGLLFASARTEHETLAVEQDALGIGSGAAGSG